MKDGQFLTLWGTIWIAASVQSPEGKRLGLWVGVVACVASLFLP